MALLAFHVLTAVVFGPRAGVPVWEALFLRRALPLRQLAGGQHRRLIKDTGEFERLMSSVGLHTDAMHLGVNVMAIVVIGRLLEPLVGPVRLISGFLLCGLGGSLGSFAYGPSISDGASGGAFGLLGMLIVVGLRRREELHEPDRTMITRWLPMFAVLNLLLSIVLPFVDLVAHATGLGVGLVLGLVPRGPRGGQVAELVIIGALLAWALC